MAEINRSQVWGVYEELKLVAKNGEQLGEIIRSHSSGKVYESRVVCAAVEMALAVRYCRENHLF